MDLHERICAWRKVRQLSQRDLAKLVGVSAAAVAMWEGGDTSPTQENLLAVVGAFGVTMEKFYGRLPNPKAA